MLKHNLIESKTIKQSYLTLQILSIFVFFICFILSYLIKLQFKYHRLALNLYDYDVETLNNSVDRDGRDSLASTTTASHFSSKRKLSSLLKRLLVLLLTKFASILLHLHFGYQFCQNCFIQHKQPYNAFAVFTHTFIALSVLLRCLVMFMSKKNSMNKLNHLKKLEQKQKDLFDPANSKNPHRYYYYYYYSYLIKSSQIACNQLKQHQNNQTNFRIFQLNDTFLFLGFLAALFQLFTFLQAVEIIALFIPILFTLILFRFKSILNATLNLVVIFLTFLFISKSSLSVKTSNFSTQSASQPAGHSISNHDSMFNLFSYNFITFVCFLVTFFFKSMLSIYYCSLTSLERWNLSFLSKVIVWRKLCILASFLVYVLFFATCVVALCVEYKHWSFLIVPIFMCLACVWFCFASLNTINLTHLMNKINDCHLLLNEPAAVSVVSESSSSKKAANLLGELSSNKRISTASQASSANITTANKSNYSRIANFKLRKFLTRFLSYNKLSAHSNGFINDGAIVTAPIHRILAYKGVRHLGSISYRISLYCFVQTILLAIFTFNSNSSFTIGVYLCVLSLNFIWISLLYQFCKSISGSCIAYALVAPPHILNMNNNGELWL